MKGFAVILLCVVAAVQGRSTGVQVVNQNTEVALGEKPWVVHLRLAIGTSGFLESCAGALIDNSWVLTSAECIDDARFIWVRFGAVEVIRPELVLETANVRVHEDWNPLAGRHNIALINLNRFVEATANIAPIGLPAANSDVSDSANYCSYGQTEHNTPGEFLRCWDVTQVALHDETVIFEGEDISASKFDIGAPLVADGNLVGLLTHADHTSDRAVFILTNAYVNWISGMTGVDFYRAAPAPAPEGPQDIIFVN